MDVVMGGASFGSETRETHETRETREKESHRIAERRPFSRRGSHRPVFSCPCERRRANKAAGVAEEAAEETWTERKEWGRKTEERRGNR
jgi:hypothetical protein